MLTLIVILALLNTLLLLKFLAPKRTKISGTAVLLDTSAIMDGRIVEVVRSGFVPSQLLIPRFVIAEMQLLADKADHLKRERARYGLQVIQDLQDSRYATVSIISDDIKSETGVDEKLVKLAIKLKALLFTTDFNLLKVAEIEGVRVLNINELAQNLRPTHVPGESVEIKIVARGQEKSQGVGYLEDGTMVVVEKAGNQQGKKLRVEVTRSLQTAAGRMMFARSRSHASHRRESQTEGTQPKRKYERKQTVEDKLIKAINGQGQSSSSD